MQAVTEKIIWPLSHQQRRVIPQVKATWGAEMNGNLINNFIFCNLCKGTRALELSVPIATGLEGKAMRELQWDLAVRLLAFTPNKNLNIHYISGSEVLGLRGLWKMSTLSNVQMLPQIGDLLIEKASYRLCKGEGSQIFSSHSSSTLEPLPVSSLLSWPVVRKREKYCNFNSSKLNTISC